MSHASFIVFSVNVNNNVRAIDCSHGCCCLPSGVLQFIDLKIAGYRHVQPGCANIFGFFAVRENVEPLRNYVYRRGIDNYEAVNVKRDTVVLQTCIFLPARFSLSHQM
jgi:hypothetical protein